MESVGDTLKKYEIGKSSDRHETRTRKINPNGMYTTVFFGVSRFFELSPIDNLLLHTINSLANNSSNHTGLCFASQEYIAEAMSVTPQTINERLQRLQEKQLIVSAGRHPTYKTIQWRLTAKVNSRIKEVQMSINKKKGNKGY